MNTKHITTIFAVLMLAVLCASAYVSVPTITDGIGFQYENITIGDDRIQIGNTNITKETTFTICGYDAINRNGSDCICSGIDDQVEIQSIISRVPGYYPSRIMFFGTFNTSSEIEVPSNITLVFEDATFIVDSTTEMNLFVNDDRINGNENIKIVGGMFDGQRGDTAFLACPAYTNIGCAFLFENVSVLSIKNAYIKNFAGNSIGTVQCTDVSIFDNYITNCAGFGSVEITACDNTNIILNVIERSALDNINTCTGSELIRITNNVLRHCGGTGVWITDAFGRQKNVSIGHNVIYNNSANGIRAVRVKGELKIESNEIYMNGANGVYCHILGGEIDSNDWVVITNNDIINNGNYGIRASAVTQILCAMNDVHGNGDASNDIVHNANVGLGSKVAWNVGRYVSVGSP